MLNIIENYLSSFLSTDELAAHLSERGLENKEVRESFPLPVTNKKMDAFIYTLACYFQDRPLMFLIGVCFFLYMLASLLVKSALWVMA